jgi:hypothetical protein
MIKISICNMLLLIIAISPVTYGQGSNKKADQRNDIHYTFASLDKYFSIPREQKDAAKGPSQKDTLSYINRFLSENQAEHKEADGIERVIVDLQLAEDGLLTFAHKHVRNGKVQYVGREEVYIRRLAPYQIKTSTERQFPDEGNTGVDKNHIGIQIVLVTEDKSTIRSFTRRIYEPWRLQDHYAVVWGLVIKTVPRSTASKLIEALKYLCYRDTIEYPEPNSERNKKQYFRNQN